MNEMTFDSFDKLERKGFAERLTKVITTFYPFANSAYVLSLNASYGSGKTTFLRMWKSFLEGEGYEVVYLNAWETDFDNEPLIPIASALLKEINPNTAGEKTKKALQGVLGVAALVGNSVLEKATGIDAKRIMEDVESNLTEDDLEKQGKTLCDSFYFKKAAYERLKTSLSDYVSSLGKKPLIILVDELDRVRPDYSVRFLEAIKHIFSVEGVCFVLAVDRKQLESSVRQLYGDVDFENYYRRFVTREAELPEPVDVDWDKFIGQIANEYISKKTTAGVRFAFVDTQLPGVLKFAASLCRVFRLTPRQAEHLFRIYSQFMAINQGQREYYNAWVQMPLFLIAVSINGDNEFYHQIGRGLLEPDKIHEYINTLYFSGRGADGRKRYLLYNVLAFSLTEENTEYTEQAVNIYIKLESPSAQQMDRNDILGRIMAPFDQFSQIPDSETGFQSLYKRLEDWRSFID
jgi:hypothetical protein